MDESTERPRGIRSPSMNSALRSRDCVCWSSSSSCARMAENRAVHCADGMGWSAKTTTVRCGGKTDGTDSIDGIGAGCANAATRGNAAQSASASRVTTKRQPLQRRIAALTPACTGTIVPRKPPSRHPGSCAQFTKLVECSTTSVCARAAHLSNRLIEWIPSEGEMAQWK